MKLHNKTIINIQNFVFVESTEKLKTKHIKNYQQEYSKSIESLKINGFNGQNIPMIFKIKENQIEFTLVDYAHKKTIANIFKKLNQEEKKEWFKKDQLLFSGCGCSVIIKSSDNKYIVSQRNNKTHINSLKIDLLGEGFCEQDIVGNSLNYMNSFYRCIDEELKLKEEIKKIECLGVLFNPERPSFDFIAKVELNKTASEIIKHFNKNLNLIDAEEISELKVLSSEDFNHFSSNIIFLIDNKIINLN